MYLSYRVLHKNFEYFNYHPNASFFLPLCLTFANLANTFAFPCYPYVY